MTFQEQAIINVHGLQQIFEKSFAVYGTALGSLREKNIISHDLDTDLGIFTEDFSWDLVNKAIALGYNIRSVFGMRHYGLEISFIKNEVKTDLMVFYHDGEKVFNCLWDNGGKNGMTDKIIHEYDQSVFLIEDGQLGWCKVKTLGLKYILAVYGENWQIPVKHWNWKEDHLCLKK